MARALLTQVACSAFIIGILLFWNTADSAENLALRQPTFQSSTTHLGYSSRAVDGNRNPNNVVYKSCTRTVVEDYAWWAVDLERTVTLESVLIVNREDCCHYWTHNFLIAATDVDPRTGTNFADMDVCHQNLTSMGAGEVKSFPCNATGRYVVIKQFPMEGGTTYALILCEVEVYEALAYTPTVPVTPEPTPAPPRGPFSFRASLNSNVSKCSLGSLTPDEQIRARQCYSQCLVNSCCKAVNVTTCEESYLITESLDYVKEGVGTEPREECSCSGSAGDTGGFPFSMYDIFEASESNIRKITTYYVAGEGLKGLAVEYENDNRSFVGFKSSDVYECTFGEDELITKVIMFHKWINPYLTVHSMEFHTATGRICGPTGPTPYKRVTVTGHQLLFFTGYYHDQVHRLTVHFDYDCTVHTNY